MTRRVNSDLLPVFALPDGETGPRGFGRPPGQDGTETMREHAEVVRPVRR